MRPKPLTPLVGRAAELRVALEAAASAHDGRGQLLLMQGEAGIGKTRLCHEIRSHQDRNGTQVLTGRAVPGDRDLQYSAVADSLRGARRFEPRLWAAASRRATILAAVVPELAHQGSVSGAPVDRPVVFETLLDMVEEAATDRATLWFLEDLHWADPATWEFAAYAARRVGDMALSIVVTFRDEELPSHRWSRLLALGRERDVAIVELDRLGAADTHTMIRNISPALSPAVVERVAVRSAGNPLLVEELLTTTSRDAPGAIPDIVKAAVRERMGGLDAASRAVLEAAAALGPRFEVDLLLKIAVVDPDLADEQLAGGGLLVSAEEAAGDVLAFWHPLVWEAVYGEIALPRRRQLHATIADTLEGQDLQPETIARHYELAGEPQAALDTLLVARKDSGRNVGRAASLAIAALELARRHPDLQDREDELAWLATNDLFLAGRWTELEPLADDLWTARRRMAPDRRAWLANVLALDLYFQGQVSRARAAADEELAHIEAHGEGAAAGPLLSQAAFLALRCGDIPSALRHAERAMETAEASSDAEALARARTVEILARRHRGLARAEAVSELRANAELARSAGLSVSEAHALFVAACTSLHADDFAVAERAAAEAGTWYAGQSQVLHGLLHVLEGRPDPAEALLARTGREAHGRVTSTRVLADVVEAHLFLHRGELDHARQLLGDAPAEMEAVARIPMLRAAHAGACGWLAWEEGRLDDAATALHDSLDGSLSGGGYALLDTGPLMLPVQADVLMRLDRPTELQQAVERCAGADPEPDRFMVAALAAAAFRRAPSEEAAAAADRAAGAAPWPWLQGLVECWRGELLADAEAAAAAPELFDAIGSLRGVERAEAVLRGLGKRVPDRGVPGANVLSPRELEVAELVAEGLTNSAIAARLYVSRATVSSHVTHILTKLGYGSRAQIAAWVAAGHAPR